MLQPIGSLLDHSVRKSGIETQVQSSQVMEDFHEEIKKIFGPKILKRVQAKFLKNKVLSVAVLGSVLVNEIRLHQGQILENINTRHKKILVERLRFLL
ncbi:MAG: DciA family protein [Patescibacteria group bacterium]